MPAIGFLVTPRSLRLTPCGILRGYPERIVTQSSGLVTRYWREMETNRLEEYL
jgi:hypothetical protein